jgi:CheY-like chemotaxis protein
VIELARSDAKAIVRVADTGVGISPEFLPQVFDAFSQADMSSERQHGGLGLGLSITRHLVHEHGGAISVESAGAGQGATFTVELPLVAATVEPAAAGRRPRPFEPSLSGISVLVVEDEPDGREMLVTALGLAGADVVDAGTAAEALESVRTRPPDVIVCDIGLPAEDGYSFIRKVRRLTPERGGRVPAAALTAYVRAEDRLRALEAGYQIHLPKPIEPADLVSAVATLAGVGRSSP